MFDFFGESERNLRNIVTCGTLTVPRYLHVLDTWDSHHRWWLSHSPWRFSVSLCITVELHGAYRAANMIDGNQESAKVCL